MKTRSMMQSELTTANNIRDRTNRHSVIEAIKSCIHQLNLYEKIDCPNGLAIFTGKHQYCL